MPWQLRCQKKKNTSEQNFISIKYSCGNLFSDISVNADEVNTKIGEVYSLKDPAGPL